MAEIHYNLLILENSSVQGSKGSTWNKYILMAYTKSYMRMPCSIFWNTSSFAIFDYIIWYDYKTMYITKVDQSHNIKWWVFKIESYVGEQNTILCNLGYRCEPKVFIKIKGTSTMQSMWIDVLNSNMERIQQIVKQ